MTALPIDTPSDSTTAHAALPEVPTPTWRGVTSGIKTNQHPLYNILISFSYQEKHPNRYTTSNQTWDKWQEQ